MQENLYCKESDFSKPKILVTALFLCTHFTYFTMAPRILNIMGMYEPGGILIFPFTFLLSDVLTEVYSYRYTRFLIWCVILVLGIFTFFSWASMQLPSTIDYQGYTTIFTNYPKLYLGVALATFFSFFLNNTILAKSKILLEGKLFWVRSLISTSIGHASFSATWVIIFHFGEISSALILKLILCMYLWKMAFELAATPLAARLCAYLKEKEGLDLYDADTNFNPFKL